jgi:hypothetical protein
VIFDETLFSFAVPTATPSVPPNSKLVVYNDHMRNYRVELLTPDAPVELPSISGVLGASPIMHGAVPATSPPIVFVLDPMAQSSVLDAPGPDPSPTTPAPGYYVPAMHATDNFVPMSLTTPDVHVPASAIHGPIPNDLATVPLPATTTAPATSVSGPSASVALANICRAIYSYNVCGSWYHYSFSQQHQQTPSLFRWHYSL